MIDTKSSLPGPRVIGLCLRYATRGRIFPVTSCGGAALASTKQTPNCACVNGRHQMTDEKVKIAHEILQYWIENPTAQDTLEGIVTWWLTIRTIKQQTSCVKEALAMLVEDGLAIAKKRNSRTYYKMNRRKYKKIISLLEQKQ